MLMSAGYVFGKQLVRLGRANTELERKIANLVHEGANLIREMAGRETRVAEIGRTMSQRVDEIVSFFAIQSRSTT